MPSSTSHGPRGGKPGARRALRWALAGLVALWLAIALVALAIDLGWQRERIAGWLAAEVTARLGTPVQVQIEPGPLHLQGLRVSDVRVGPAEEAWLRADRVSFDVGWRAFWRRRALVLQRIEVEGWRLELTREEDGSWRRLASPPPREIPAGQPLSLYVRDLVLGEGELDVRSAGPEREQRVALRVAGEAHGLRWPVSGEALPVERAELRAQLLAASTGMRVERAWLDTARAVLSLDKSGELSVDAEARGRAGQLELEARAELAELIAAPEEARAQLRLWATEVDPSFWWPQLALPGPLEVQLRGRLQGEALTVSAGRVAGPGMRVEVRGRGSRRELDEVTIDLEADDVEPWLRGWPAAEGLRGPLRGRIELSGDPRSPTGRAVLEAPALEFAGRTWGALALELQRAGAGPLEVAAALSGRGGGDAALQATVEMAAGLAPPTAITAQLEADDIDPGELLGAPGIRLDLSAAGELRGQIWRLDRLELRHPSAQLRAQGRGRSRRLESASVSLQAELARLLPVLPVPEPARALVGSVSLEAELRGALSEPEGQLVLSVRELGLGEQPIGQLALAAASERPGTWRIETARLSEVAGRTEPEPLNLSAEAGAIVERVAVGDWSLRDLVLWATLADAPVARLGARAADLRNDHLDGQLDLRLLDLARLSHWIDPEIALTGEVFLELAATGSPTEPELAGRVSWRQPGWGPAIADLLEMEVAGPWHRLHFAARAERDGIERVSASATLPWPARREGLADWFVSPEAELHAELVGFDLAVLQPLTPSWMRALRGTVDAQLTVEGDDLMPRASGGGRVEGAGFEVPLLRQRFEPVEGEWVVRNDRITFDGVEVGQPGRGARLDGRLLLDGLQPAALDARLTLDHLPASRSPLLHADLDGQLEIDGSFEHPRLSGALVVEGARLGLRQDVDPVLKEIQLVAAPASRPLREQLDVGPDLYARSKIEVSLRVPPDSRVVGRGANLYVSGQAEARKAPLEPLSLTGEVAAQGGTYRFQSRTFRVRRGLLRLTGESPPDPVIDVEAVYPVAGVLTIVNVDGRISQPVVRLDSDPPLSDEDVLSYILFGRPTEQLGLASDSSFEAAAAQLAAGVAESELRDVLGEDMPIDTIEVRTDAEGQPSEVGVGKYITRDLFVRYGRMLGEDEGDRFGVEYQLTPKWSVESSVSTTGDAGLDLIWRHDF